MKHSTLKSASMYIFVAAIIFFYVSLNSYAQQAWTRVPSPDTSATRNLLRGISGTSSTDVWAVGDFELVTSGNERNFIMHWNGNGWQIFPGTDLSSTYNELWDVAAITTNNVWAVGTYNEPGTSRSQLLHWNGSVWSQTALPNINGGSFLFSIDAISANDIWAVGGQAGSPTRPPYTIHYNGSGWTEFPASTPGIFRNYFNAVDGISSNDVWAAGYLSNNYGDYHAMIQHWNGSSWSNVALPSSVVSQLGELSNVTMIASNNVWAAGSTATGNILLIHWDGTSWSEMSTTGFSGGAIIARGTDVFSVGDRISQWNGSNWVVIETLNQLSFPALVTADAFPNGDIWAAGRTFDTAFHTLVYRTANAMPQFIHGNTQTLNAVVNSSLQSIDEMLRVQDADISQVVIYNTLVPPSHGTLNGLSDTTITNNGFAMPSGVTYAPVQGYSGADQFIVKVSVGPLNSQVTINIVVSGPLPALISDYTIIKTGTSATMQWTSLSEINVKEFMMERSEDGISYTVINRIPSKGTGYNYKLIDPSPVPGLNYYRLQQIDMDGKATIFPVKILDFDTTELKPFFIFPNPAVDKVLNIKLNVAGDWVISLYNMEGQQLMKRIISNTPSSIRLSLPDNITTGMYMLSLVKDEIIYSQKIIIK